MSIMVCVWGGGVGEGLNQWGGVYRKDPETDTKIKF